MDSLIALIIAQEARKRCITKYDIAQEAFGEEDWDNGFDLGDSIGIVTSFHAQVELRNTTVIIANINTYLENVLLEVRSSMQSKVIKNFDVRYLQLIANMYSYQLASNMISVHSGDFKPVLTLPSEITLRRGNFILTIIKPID